MISWSKSKLILCSLIVLPLVLFSGCNEVQEPTIPPQKSELEKIQESGELVVLTRNAPTTFYQIKNGFAGLEYDLIKAFARSIGVTPRFITKDSTHEILEALQKGDASIAAAGLTRTDARERHFIFGPSYQEVEQQLVCRRGNVIPKKIEELPGVPLLVTANSSYVDTLKKLKQKIPELSWTESSEFDTETLLEMVWEKKTACTIADSNIVSINRRYFPELTVAFNINGTESLSWLFPEKATQLQTAVSNWFIDYKEAGKLAIVTERYYGFVHLYNYVNIKKFKRNIKKRLPKYLDHFKVAAEQYDLPWTLLAAQSYQESLWRPRAKSPTGVRGMMMLTLQTAREMGITNRINAKNSIFGGAKYMRRLYERIPEEIYEPDRTWFTLAAYNVGMGHLQDAMKLAVELDKNPNSWNDIATILPLLSQKKYYKKLRFGYARGNEPVQYVHRIRDFHDILEQEISSDLAFNEMKSCTTC